MTDRLDPAPHVANARQLADLATRARAAYHDRLVDDGVRVGVARDQAARAKSAAEQQRTSAEAQSKARAARRRASRQERRPTWSGGPDRRRRASARTRSFVSRLRSCVRRPRWPAGGRTPPTRSRTRYA